MVSAAVRGIVLLFTLLCLALAAALFAVAGGWDPSVTLARWVALGVGHPWLAGGLGGLLVFLGGLVAWLVLPRPGGPRATAVTETEWGEVAVSLDAVQDLVVRTARGVPGVKDVGARITPKESGVEVRLALTVLPDQPIPELGEAVQRQVESQVKGLLGVHVTAVRVAIQQVVRDGPRTE